MKISIFTLFIFVFTLNSFATDDLICELKDSQGNVLDTQSSQLDGSEEIKLQKSYGNPNDNFDYIEYQLEYNAESKMATLQVNSNTFSKVLNSGDEIASFIHDNLGSAPDVYCRIGEKDFFQRGPRLYCTHNIYGPAKEVDTYTIGPNPPEVGLTFKRQDGSWGETITLTYSNPRGIGIFYGTGGDHHTPGFRFTAKNGDGIKIDQITCSVY